MLADKVAFITGAASGIGAETARRFAEEGARVVLADLHAQRGRELEQQLLEKGHDVQYVPCDVAEPDSVEQAIQVAVERYGRLDVVFANAGINGVWAAIEELPPKEWERTLRVNLTGTYLTVHFAVPHLKAAGGGSIIITSSVNGNRTFSNGGAAAYAASKAGQVAFMKMMALELGRHNIRCNAVCPGYMKTNLGESTDRRNVEEIGLQVNYPQGSPALRDGRGEPENVANLCVFLASDLNRQITGVEIYVDGGVSLFR